MVKLLGQWGAKVSVLARNGLTAMDISITNGTLVAMFDCID